MINIRAATISDIEALVRVHHAALHGSAPSTFYEQSILQSWSPSPTDKGLANQFRQAIENSEELMVVAESAENAAIVGFGSIILSKQELCTLYVDPAFGRQGIGSKILAYLEEFALLNGTNKLHMDALLNAEKFYFRHGYSVIERASHRLRSGTVIDCVKMSKDLHAYQ